MFAQALGLPPPFGAVCAGHDVTAVPSPIRPLRLGEYADVETVTPDECIAHLKLLSAMTDLRDTISRTDGLFSVHDSQIGPSSADGQQRAKALALLREKRWQIYVSRAVDRFTKWIQNCIRVDHGLGWNNGVITMEEAEKAGCRAWTRWNYRIPWTVEMLPPLERATLQTC
ncbi:hypothetical protein VTO42DRAFT_4498 [Malbranchea cinnamomea]